MKKKAINPASSLISIVKHIRRSEITPFVQKPAENYFPKSSGNVKEELSGPELFSLFTADIIREDVRFTR